ncbi:metalloregulator ArsR/SmtB family transcription factor [Metallosphaera hakonensis JCM 8857 = DSM 7519]|uniref:Transcriptional regulator n=2 Tax=Metallosphaera hakonensis TaxID=79601 RepID=A0A2U9IR57_9CREN|nr:metalloregulator ArsR/SmtB family transcription factor [Metallosphaera hakonensis JCM 8857 = DSM 7519]
MISLNYEEMSSLLGVLADKTRLRILSLLRTDELCVCELEELVPGSQSNISQHLFKLKSFKLVNERKRGQWKYYRINNEIPKIVIEILDLLPDTREEIAAFRARGSRCRI